LAGDFGKVVGYEHELLCKPGSSSRQFQGVWAGGLRLARAPKGRYKSKLSESKNTGDCTQAIVDALVAGRIAAADRNQITFSARPGRPMSFGFNLHSKFPETVIYDPGMHPKIAFPLLSRLPTIARDVVRRC